MLSHSIAEQLGPGWRCPILAGVQQKLEFVSWSAFPVLFTKLGFVSKIIFLAKLTFLSHSFFFFFYLFLET